MTSLTIFAQNMRSLAGNVQRNSVELQRRVSVRVVELVATATPQLTGQASGNWQTSVGGMNPSWVAGPNSPTTSIANAVSALSGLAPGQTVNITNNVPYIIDLNNGSSQKAPAAFVESSIMSALGQVERFNLLVR